MKFISFSLAALASVAAVSADSWEPPTEWNLFVRSGGQDRYVAANSHGPNWTVIDGTTPGRFAFPDDVPTEITGGGVLGVDDTHIGTAMRFGEGVRPFPIRFTDDKATNTRFFICSDPNEPGGFSLYILPVGSYVGVPCQVAELFRIPVDPVPVKMYAFSGGQVRFVTATYLTHGPNWTVIDGTAPGLFIIRGGVPTEITRGGVLGVDDTHIGTYMQFGIGVRPFPFEFAYNKVTNTGFHMCEDSNNPGGFSLHTVPAGSYLGVGCQEAELFKDDW